MRFTLQRSLLGATVFAAAFGWIACSTDPAIEPLVYREGFKGNVSSLYGTVGPSRESTDDLSAPEFFWRRADGSLDSLSGQQGKYVILNFFADWCINCRDEAPMLQRFSQAHKDSVVVLGVDIDGNGDIFNIATNYVQRYHWTFQVVTDSLFRVFNPYVFDPTGSSGIPYTIIIGRDGEIRKDIRGAMSDTLLNFYLRNAQ